MKRYYETPAKLDALVEAYLPDCDEHVIKNAGAWAQCLSDQVSGVPTFFIVAVSDKSDSTANPVEYVHDGMPSGTRFIAETFEGAVAYVKRNYPGGDMLAASMVDQIVSGE